MRPIVMPPNYAGSNRPAGDELQQIYNDLVNELYKLRTHRDESRDAEINSFISLFRDRSDLFDREERGQRTILSLQIGILGEINRFIQVFSINRIDKLIDDKLNQLRSVTFDNPELNARNTIILERLNNQIRQSLDLGYEFNLHHDTLLEVKTRSWMDLVYEIRKPGNVLRMLGTMVPVALLFGYQKNEVSSSSLAIYGSVIIISFLLYGLYKYFLNRKAEEEHELYKTLNTVQRDLVRHNVFVMNNYIDIKLNELKALFSTDINIECRFTQPRLDFESVDTRPFGQIIKKIIDTPQADQKRVSCVINILYNEVQNVLRNGYNNGNRGLKLIRDEMLVFNLNRLNALDLHMRCSISDIKRFLKFNSAQFSQQGETDYDKGSTVIAFYNAFKSCNMLCAFLFYLDPRLAFWFNRNSARIFKVSNFILLPTCILVPYFLYAYNNVVPVPCERFIKEKGWYDYVRNKYGDSIYDAISEQPKDYFYLKRELFVQPIFDWLSNDWRAGIKDDYKFVSDKIFCLKAGYNSVFLTDSITDKDKDVLASFFSNVSLPFNTFESKSEDYVLLLEVPHEDEDAKMKPFKLHYLYKPTGETVDVMAMLGDAPHFGLMKTYYFNEDSFTIRIDSAEDPLLVQHLIDSVGQKPLIQVLDDQWTIIEDDQRLFNGDTINVVKTWFRINPQDKSYVPVDSKKIN